MNVSRDRRMKDKKLQNLCRCGNERYEQEENAAGSICRVERMPANKININIKVIEVDKIIDS